jgi:cell division protein FtsZ
VDSLITIPNEKLLSVLGRQMTLLEAFRVANDVLRGAVQGIAELITRPGLINVDFADVRTVMSEMGMAMMGTGIASGETRARDAAEAAINSPLLENVNLAGAKGLLVNITAGMDMAIGEFDEVGATVQAMAAEEANVVVGTVIDPEMTDDLRVTIVATGIASGIASKDRASVAEPRRNVRLVKQPVSPPIMEPEPREESLQVSAQEAPPMDTPQVAAAGGGRNLNYLDIPAFLRRQAD